MTFRAYNPERDLEAIRRIWKEVGWLENENIQGLDLFIEAGRTLVADIDGSAECSVINHSGTIRYLDEDLPFSVVGAVTTSRIARKQKLAARLTALAVANDAAKGYLVSGLGMFEQGYYNQLGFGSGNYCYDVSFDPAGLTVDVKPRVPRRITKDDWETVHASRMARHRGHGAVCVTSPLITRGEMLGDKESFGLGYYDGSNGELTHHMWIDPKAGAWGEYRVRCAIWQTGEQFLELMALLKSLGDQVNLVHMSEPQGIQLQDLMRQPIRHMNMSEGSKYKIAIKAGAHWQLRILDLCGCLARTHLPCADVRFNLKLTDPIEKLLDSDAPWHGISGDYMMTLGSESSAIPGSEPSLPTLTTTVNAFTRMWYGIRPASGLAITDDLSGPPQLIRTLDEAFRLPSPYLGWGI